MHLFKTLTLLGSLLLSPPSASPTAGAGAQRAALREIKLRFVVGPGFRERYDTWRERLSVVTELTSGSFEQAAGIRLTVSACEPWDLKRQQGIMGLAEIRKLYKQLQKVPSRGNEIVCGVVAEVRRKGDLSFRLAAAGGQHLVRITEAYGLGGFHGEHCIVFMPGKPGSNTPGSRFIQANLLQHELGHVFGLRHTIALGSAMRWRGSGTEYQGMIPFCEGSRRDLLANRDRPFPDPCGPLVRRLFQKRPAGGVVQRTLLTSIFTGAHENLITRLLEHKPTFAPFWDFKADFHRRRGDLDAAVAAYRKALELNPKAPRRHLYLAQVLRQASQSDQEIKSVLRESFHLSRGAYSFVSLGAPFEAPLPGEPFQLLLSAEYLQHIAPPPLPVR